MGGNGAQFNAEQVKFTRRFDLAMASGERLYRLKRKYDLDPDTLHCPICTDPLSPPVYQVMSWIVCRVCCNFAVSWGYVHLLCVCA